MRKKPERERKEGQPYPPTFPRKPEDIQHKALGFGLERWHSKVGEPILFCQPHMSATSWTSSTSGTSIWKPGFRQQPFCPPKSTLPRHTHTHTHTHTHFWMIKTLLIQIQKEELHFIKSICHDIHFEIHLVRFMSTFYSRNDILVFSMPCYFYIMLAQIWHYHESLEGKKSIKNIIKF